MSEKGKYLVQRWTEGGGADSRLRWRDVVECARPGEARAAAAGVAATAPIGERVRILKVLEVIG